MDKILVRDNAVAGVETQLGEQYLANAVIVTTGTFLKGLMHIGMKTVRGGRMGDFPSDKLSDNLQEIGFHLERFKTGTPARVDGNSIDFSK